MFVIVNATLVIYLNDVGFVALLHTSHAVSAFAVPTVATPSPAGHVVWGYRREGAEEEEEEEEEEERRTVHVSIHG